MPLPIPAALGSSFNEPQSNDPTSAPPMPDEQPQTTQPMQGQLQGLAQALAQRKKKGLIGPTVKRPSALSAAIARSRRARPSGLKYG